MKKVFSIFLSFTLVAALATPTVLASSGSLSVSDISETVSETAPATFNQTLMRFRVSASGSTTTAQKYNFIVDDPDGIVSSYYLFLEDVNALMDVASGSTSSLSMNGSPIIAGRTETIVLKADLRDVPGTVQVTLDNIQVEAGVSLNGLPMTGGLITFTSDNAPDPLSEPAEEPAEAVVTSIEANTTSQPSTVSVEVIEETVVREEVRFKTLNPVLVDDLLGKILLQVEEHGEAWYLEKDSRTRYYLADGNEALTAMRSFGLGISNADLEKIPVGIDDRFVTTDTDGDGLGDQLEDGIGTDKNNPDTDGDGFSDGDEVKEGYNPLGEGSMPVDTDLVNRLSGNILLQVDAHGEAWYVNPADGKRYYMLDGDAAYQIMRFLSLGVTNVTLDSIPVGRL